jgi:hypothetical protein
MPERDEQTGKLVDGQRHPEVLFHFSEDPTIERFVPRIAQSSVMRQELVWAVDAEHAYMYYFPRDCPRVTFYSSERTSGEDKERFFGQTMAGIVVAIETAWLSPVQSTKLYRYEFAADGFEPTDVAGYWISRHEVVPRSVEPVGDLLTALATAGVEIRIMPSLWPLQEAVIASTLEFDNIRWRNAAPRPEAMEAQA